GIGAPMPAAVGLLTASGAAGFRVGSTARDECLPADDAGAGFDASSEPQQGLCPSSRYVEPTPPRGDALGTLPYFTPQTYPGTPSKSPPIVPRFGVLGPKKIRSWIGYTEPLADKSPSAARHLWNFNRGYPERRGRPNPGSLRKSGGSPF